MTLFIVQIVSAQGNLPGGFEHIIEVGQYSDWGRGYLTITDDNVVRVYEEGKLKGLYNLTYFPIKNEKGKVKELYKGDLVLEVNGESAKGWTKEQFYRKVDNCKDVITFKVRTKFDDGIKDRIVSIQPKNELDDDLKPFGNDFTLKDVKGITPEQERKSKLVKGTLFDERTDNDYDFFTCTKYDYLITSNNPLLDKDILNKIGCADMKQDDESPDLLFTIARDADESISSTYIPPTSRTVNVGSKTRTQYNYITKQNDYITTQKNKTIYEGGYTHETKTMDLFLEIAALDVKRINDKTITYPPIVWQATVKRHVSDAAKDFETSKNFMAWATWMNFPPYDRRVIVEKTIYAPLGVICDSNDPKIIVAVESGSRAEKAGLRPGDKLLKAESMHDIWKKDIKKGANKNGWKALDEWYARYDLNIEIKRGSEKKKLVLDQMKLELSRVYWIGAK